MYYWCVNFNVFSPVLLYFRYASVSFVLVRGVLSLNSNRSTLRLPGSVPTSCIRRV